MPDFYREDDWWRHARISIWIIWRRRGCIRCRCHGTAGRCAAVLFWFISAESRPIYCGDGELLHHIPEQLSKRRGTPTNGSDAHTPSGVTGHGRICLYGDLQRFGRRIDLRVKRGLKPSGHWPHSSRRFVRNERRLVSGTDCRAGRQHVRVKAQLHETLPDGAVIHIVPRVAGPSQVAYSRLSWGLPPLPDILYRRSHPCSMGGSHWDRW